MNKRDYHSAVEHITDAEQAQLDSVRDAMTAENDNREAAPLAGDVAWRNYAAAYPQNDSIEHRTTFATAWDDSRRHFAALSSRPSPATDEATAPTTEQMQDLIVEALERMRVIPVPTGWTQVRAYAHAIVDVQAILTRSLASRRSTGIDAAATKMAGATALSSAVCAEMLTKGWTFEQRLGEPSRWLHPAAALASRPSSTPPPATEKHDGHLFDSTCPACQETISKFIQRVEASGLGTTGAKALRSTIDDAHAAEVVARSQAPAADDHAALVDALKGGLNAQGNEDLYYRDDGAHVVLDGDLDVAELARYVVAALEGQGQKRATAGST